MPMPPRYGLIHTKSFRSTASASNLVDVAGQSPRRQYLRSRLCEHPWRHDMTDKQVVLITGALTGIGRATAIALAQEGARLVVSGRHEQAGQALAEELRSLGAEAEFILTDVRQDD